MAILHTSTVLFSKSVQLARHLSRLPQVYRENVLFFALSADAHSESELSAIVSSLTSFSNRSVGCLSSSVSPWLKSNVPRISCSLAVFDKSATTAFRSTIPGRAEPQVGRWHAFRKKGEASPPPGTYSVGLKEDVNWEDVWKRDLGGNELPQELRGLSPETVKGVAYFSDLAPEGLNNALNALPNANKLGLLASSTPFITGRPVTLFHDGQIYSDGAVGIATTKSNTVSSVDFHGLREITPLYQITRSDGNLVQELDNSSPAGILLNAIRSSAASDSLAQDEEYFLGVTKNNKLQQVYRIMSGDPARGTISLETGVAPPAGTSVKLYHLPNDAGAESITFAPSPRTVSFLSTPGTRDNEKNAVGEPEELDIREDMFLAGSENGWMLSRSVDKTAEEAWRCTVNWGKGGIKWA